MASPTDIGTGALTGATIMAFSFGGVTTEHFLLGCACYTVGSFCRFALKVTSALEKGLNPKWAASVGVLAVSPMLAAFASMATFFAAHLAGFEGEAGIGLLLCLMALKGPEGIEYMSSIFSKFLPEKLTGPATEPKP